MKKLLGILVLSFLLYNPSSFAVMKGAGEVKLSDRSLENFLYYIRCDWPGKKQEKCKPALFVVSSDGDWSYFHYCAYNECWFNERKTVRQCESETGVTCGVFAVRRGIVWENGIKKEKKSLKISNKWSDQEVKDELARLGFYGEMITQSENLDIIEKIKSLKKLYDQGVLTKEEFEKAKKRLLN